MQEKTDQMALSEVRVQVISASNNQYVSLAYFEMACP